jgi:hypothetical protein
VSIPKGAKRGQILSSLPGGTAAVLLIHIGNTADDDGSNRPEKLQHLCGRGSEPHRYDLTAVGRSVGNLFELRSISLFPRVSSYFARPHKDTPGNTLRDLRNEENRQRIREEHDEYRGVE